MCDITVNLQILKNKQTTVLLIT